MEKVDGRLCWDPKVTPNGLRHAQVKMYLHSRSVLLARAHSSYSCVHSAAGIELCAMRTARIAWTSAPCLSQANAASWVQHEARHSRLCLYCAMNILFLWPGGKKPFKNQAQGPDHHLSWGMGSPQPLALPWRPLKVPVNLWCSSCGSLTGCWAAVVKGLL